MDVREGFKPIARLGKSASFMRRIVRAKRTRYRPPKIVEQTCRDFGVKHNEHRTFAVGVASHYRWLRYLGRAEPQVG